MEWYSETYGHAARYDHLLEELARTPTERQQILRDFFQPDDEERERGVKRPSAGHRSIARLVAAGHVRIIVTLNFDRLVEQALQEVGIEPTVVSTPDDVVGLAPLHTHRALVIHLHGDYLTPLSMLNTETELAEYDTRMDRLLDQLFRDYGVVAIGWSAVYDPQLCAAIARSVNPHATGYWVEPGRLGERAEQLRVNKGYVLVEDTADSFLAQLADTVDALTLRGARHPLTVPVAVATAKRELRGDRTAIEIHDRFHAEVARVDELPEMNRSDPGRPMDGQTPEQLQARIEEAAMVSAALVATCAYWGNEVTDGWWMPAIERWATPVRGSGATRSLRAPNIPACLLQSAGLTAAAAAGRFDLAHNLLTEPHVDTFYGRIEPAASALAPSTIYVDTETPHARVHAILRPVFVDELGLTSGAYDEAWEVGETLRDVIALYSNARDSLALRAASQASLNLAHQEQLAEQMRADGITGPHAGVVETRQALNKALDELAGFFDARGHVRVRKDHSPDRNFYFIGVVASAMAARVDRQQGMSPLVQAGLADARADYVHKLRVLLHAVAIGQGATGQHYLRSSRSRAMDDPQQFWLDTLDAVAGHR
ncbi:SIR2 family NAD-dependent protein deacylase [Nocardioides okcheonensis]|uniref:SIR2 family NAD-dependent protein deacylase n=1 Tax=Nocardioides okcheonensis TaxID=2894081 RepID=UPI001E44AC6E|nr:SIR2 family protein [Nocardioides okcheonensis]UFN46154.1 SIR2 family protein [Nocardioides okcheonensis]